MDNLFFDTYAIIEIIKGNQNYQKYRDLSSADVIGYATAQKLGIKFLTGDEDFKDMPNVEFVKK